MLYLIKRGTSPNSPCGDRYNPYLSGERYSPYLSGERYNPYLSGDSLRGEVQSPPSLPLQSPASTMLPLSLLRTAQNHPMLVELKNGETYNGHLVSCDNWMNINLREVRRDNRPEKYSDLTS